MARWRARTAEAIAVALGAWATLFANVAQAQPALPRFDGQVHMGVATCAGPCHGRQSALGVAEGPAMRGSEIVVWQDLNTLRGKHSQAYKVLQDARAHDIARKLGIGDPASAQECLSCHSDDPAAGKRGLQLLRSDGVSCEACHGGAGGKWLASHYAPGATHAQNVANGMYPTDNPVARARLCESCHLGASASDQYVTHRIMGAGHPRLTFELELFTALQAHHYEDQDYARRKPIPNRAKVWAIGQASAFRSDLELYLDSPHARAGVFPEETFFDCRSCHRLISDSDDFRSHWRANPGRPDGPGVPVFNDANLIVLVAASRAVSPGLASTLDARGRAFHAALQSGANVRPAGEALIGALDEVLANVSSRPSFRPGAGAHHAARGGLHLAVGALHHLCLGRAGHHGHRQPESHPGRRRASPAAGAAQAWRPAGAGRWRPAARGSGRGQAAAFPRQGGDRRRLQDSGQPQHLRPGGVQARHRSGRQPAGTVMRRAGALRIVRRLMAAAVFGAAVASSGCGGGSSSSSTPAVSTTPVATTATPLYAAPAAESLSVSDVKTILAQAIAEATARKRPSTIAVTDRVGNVLAVYTMAGAPSTTHIPSPPSGVNTDLEGADVPSNLAAISKAVTGAYLSSAGNAFSTRTASEIVQPHFPPSPGATGLESGPLFGVQFSQLPCSDLSQRYSAASAAAASAMIGPKRAPLGLAADPGGLPLYKNGADVGAIGVEGDGAYAFDPDVTNTSGNDDEELIAVAGSVGYAAPAGIRADQISLAGTTLALHQPGRQARCCPPPPARPAFDSLTATTGALTTVRGYYGEAGTAVLAGTVFGTEASGVRKATTAEYTNPDIYVLSDGSGNNRYPITAGQDGAEIASPLTTAEVSALLNQAFSVMSNARAAIRQPLNTRAQVTLTVTDTYGNILGLIVAPDATLFGVDVSVQKARSVAFLSGRYAAADISNTTRDPALAEGDADTEVQAFVAEVRTFLGLPDALTGDHAYADRSIGDIARPFFPDGQDDTQNGPLSYPITNWSPFATGLQTALIRDNVVQGVAYSAGIVNVDTPQKCTFLPNVSSTVAKNRLQNGLQIFPGGVPIYRGSSLVGALGISGDGVDQDDLIAFMGAHNAATQTATIDNAPASIRADQIVVPGSSVRLRYVSCPVSPYLDSNAQNVCQGL